MSKNNSTWKNLENNGAMPKYGRRGMLVNMETGEVEWNMGQWVIKNLGSIMGTQLFEDIKASYGTKDGAWEREKYSTKIMMSYNWEKKQLEVE